MSKYNSKLVLLTFFCSIAIAVSVSIAENVSDVEFTTKIKAQILREYFDGTTEFPDGWTTIVNVPTYTWEVKDPEGVGTGFAKSEPNCVEIEWQNEVTQNEWFITPELDFSEYMYGNVEFYTIGSPYWGQFATLEVWLHSDPANMTNGILLYKFPEPSDPNHIWFKVQRNLPGVGNSKAYIGFRYIGLDGDFHAVDNVRVFASNTIGINSTSLGRVKATFK